MSQLGGRSVAIAARTAGFTGDEVRRAEAVAFAATRWQDHYELDVPGSPSLSRWGLFATPPDRYPGANPRDLFKAHLSAVDAYRYWMMAGGRWDWHPVVQDNGGARVIAAWRYLDQHGLWESKARQVPPSGVPLGHPIGAVPAHLNPFTQGGVRDG